MGGTRGHGTPYRFCPHCATALAGDDRDRARCAGCGFVQYRNPIAAVAAIVLARGEALPPPGSLITPAEATHLLLVRRASTHAGAWCIPCGYVEHDEEIRAAAARELMEETGLTAVIEEVFAVHSNFHDPFDQTVGTWFLARYVSGGLRAGDDADRAAFFAIAAPPEPLAFPTDRRVIAALRAQQRSV
jgi:8-oxo-dGTP diphosphatase